MGGPKATERVLLGLIVFSIVVAAASLVFPSTPSYDPWSWIIWGRQIVHGTLHLQNGPSWKPLPVIFTTVFGLFGQAAPNLWLVVARGGALLASLMSFWMAARLTWWLRDQDDADGVTLANLAPAVLAGAVAMVGLVLSSEFLSTSILGYSEGLMIAATLIAIERHIDGHPRQAFAVGMLAALDRPEFWVLWGPYGLWLMWKDRRSATWSSVWARSPWRCGSCPRSSAVSRSRRPQPTTCSHGRQCRPGFLPVLGRQKPGLGSDALPGQARRPFGPARRRAPRAAPMACTRCRQATNRP